LSKGSVACTTRKKCIREYDLELESSIGGIYGDRLIAFIVLYTISCAQICDESREIAVTLDALREGILEFSQ